MNWEALVAIGTVLSAITALGIALFSHIQSERRERKSREKEAIEKILTPIRKELNSFSVSKWDTWQFRNRWSALETMKLDYPLQYFWLDKKIKKLLEDFDEQFDKFGQLSERYNAEIVKLISATFKNFLVKNGISNEIAFSNGFADEYIINAHW